MNELEKKLKVLAKMFPNDMAFGAEVRNIVWEIRKKESEERKEEWDKLKTTDDFLEWDKNRKIKQDTVSPKEWLEFGNKNNNTNENS